MGGKSTEAIVEAKAVTSCDGPAMTGSEPRRPSPTDAPFPMKSLEGLDAAHGHDDQGALPLFRDEPVEPRRDDVVLSIKPVYSKAILEGRKTVELRRRFPISAGNGARAYIYATSPVKAMVGTGAIREVLNLAVEQIWTRFESMALVARDPFDKYFEGIDHGFALILEDVKILPRSLSLGELRERFGFRPPQSFLYAKHDLRTALKDEQAVISH